MERASATPSPTRFIANQSQQRSDAYLNYMVRSLSRPFTLHELKSRKDYERKERVRKLRKDKGM